MQSGDIWGEFLADAIIKRIQFCFPKHYTMRVLMGKIPLNKDGNNRRNVDTITGHKTKESPKNTTTGF